MIYELGREETNVMYVSGFCHAIYHGNLIKSLSKTKGSSHFISQQTARQASKEKEPKNAEEANG